MLNSQIRLPAIVIALLIAVVTTASCAGGGGSSSTTSSGASEPSIGMQKGGAPATSGATESSAAPANSASSTVDTTASWDRKIVRNADIALQVSSVESMLSTIRTIVDSAGGVVFASSTSYSGNNQIASMTLDVPAEQFDQVVNQLRSAPGVKKVDRESISSQDVTDQYVDLQSQLRNLQATQARLQALMSQATQLQDILTIEQELSRVEGQIEQVQGRINYLDKHTSFSRITVTLTPFGVVAETGPKQGFDLGKAVHDAWEASLTFTGGILTAVVKAGVFLWWFWPIAAIAAVVLLLRRQRRRDANRGSEIVA